MTEDRTRLVTHRRALSALLLALRVTDSPLVSRALIARQIDSVDDRLAALSSCTVNGKPL